MGMYDYLGGEQIKIFYVPILSVNKQQLDQSNVWYSHGSLQSYEKEDELPLKTLWYKYPDNFIVYDYRWELEDVWVIKNGKFERFTSYKKLTAEDLEQADAVYDYYGTPLNIQSLSDLDQIKRDFKQKNEEQTHIENLFFPKGFLHTMKIDPEFFNSKKDEYFKKLEEINEKYADRWIVKDKFPEESTFGALLECYFFARSRKDEPPIKDTIVPERDYKACKLTLQRILKETPDIVERFKAWYGNDEELEIMGLEELLKEIQAPIKE